MLNNSINLFMRECVLYVRNYLTYFSNKMKVKVNLINCYSTNEFFLELIRDDQILIISVVIILFSFSFGK